MKIEVGKAYRTRGGERVTIVRSDHSSSYPFIGDNDERYTISGLFFNRLFCRSELYEHHFDLIAEWSEPVKYRAGDHITIKLDEHDVGELNRGGRWLNVRADQIISHTPKPFDWADVKPGNAFIYSPDGEVWIYSGPWIRLEDSGEYTFNERRAFFQKKGELCRSIDIGFDLLTRAHEHDIEVKS